MLNVSEVISSFFYSLIAFILMLILSFGIGVRKNQAIILAGGAAIVIFWVSIAAFYYDAP